MRLEKSGEIQGTSDFVNKFIERFESINFSKIKGLFEFGPIVQIILNLLTMDSRLTILLNSLCIFNRIIVCII